MNRNTPIAALEKAKRIASTLVSEELQQYKAQGGKIVGIFSPDIPPEIFEAAGLMPYDMRGTGAQSTEYADKYFRQLTCEFTRTVFNNVLCGEYSFLDGAVLYNCCDHLRRIDDNWKTLPEQKLFHFLYIPKAHRPDTFVRFGQEIRALIEAVEKHFGVAITPEKLVAAIAESNKTRALIRELYDLRKGDEVYIDGTEMAQVLAVNGVIPRAQFNALLRELIDELKASGETVKPLARLMFISGHANTLELMKVMEGQGGVFVTDFEANGLLTACCDIPVTDNPEAALCDWYFNIKPASPRAFGTQDARMAKYLEIIRDFRVDGVVTARLTMCDVWAFEQYLTKQLFEAEDIPSMELEVNYILDGEGQIRTRVQAFVESLTC